MRHLVKLVYIYIGMLAFSSTVAAKTTDQFYIAANAGIFQADFSATYLDQTDVIQQNIVQSISQHGYTAGAALGYRHLLNSTYFLGAELSANAEGHNASFQAGAATAAFSDAIQIENHFDLTFVPGMMLSDAVSAYLKLGLSLAHLQDSLSSPAGYTPIMTTYNSSKNACGFAAGLGVRKNLDEHVALFTEANYHDYGTVNFPAFQNFTATYTHAAHVYSYDAVVGVAYSF